MNRKNLRENRTVFPFEWGSFPEGFTWVHGQGVWFLVACRHDNAQEERRFYQVLEESPPFYGIFATIPHTREGILSFANMYGWLGKPERIDPPIFPHPDDGVMSVWGEPLALWLKEIGLMSAAIKLWDMLDKGNETELSRVVKWEGDRAVWKLTDIDGRTVSGHILGPVLPSIAEPSQKNRYLRVQDAVKIGWEPSHGIMPLAWYALQGLINQQLEESLSPYLRVEQEFSRTLCFTPSSLIGALWFDLALTVAGKLGHRQCKYCGKTFAVGPGKARIDAEFCPKKSCRMQEYRRQKRAALKILPRRGRPPKGTGKTA